MKVKILVAAHKEYCLPQSDCYLPIQVGAEGKDRLECAVAYDSAGENISTKNSSYCELTAVYWAWKNLEADYYGLCHYRRYFRGKKGIAEDSEIIRWIEQGKVILPRRRNYYIETNYSQYIHAHHKQDLDQCRMVMSEMYPDDTPYLDAVMNRTWGHRFNMFIMKKDLFFDYCEWLFGILFELEKRLEISDYSEYDSRVFGFVAERLMDIYMESHDIGYMEIPVFETEKTKWIPKATAFLMRKIKGTKRNTG